MKTILSLIPQKTDATSFFRAAGWWADHRDVNIKLINSMDWSIFCEGDVLFLQRPYNDMHVKAAIMAKENGLKVWIDWDDNLYKVSEFNPHYETYKDVKEQLDQLQMLADIVTVSTRELQGCMTESKRAVYIPNVLPRKFHEMYRSKKDSTHDVVFWRGGKSHDEDWYAHTEELMKVKFGDTKLVLLGAPPSFLKKYLPHAEFVHGMDVVKFMQRIRHISPKINIVPLADSLFNRCKSNISWLETCWIGGAVSLAPNYQEWQVPGCFNYQDSKHFRESLQEMLSLPQSRLSSLNDEGREYIDNMQSWEQAKKVRGEVIRCLTED